MKLEEVTVTILHTNVLIGFKEVDMKQLSRFKVVQNMLVYGEYKISITPYWERCEGAYLKFVVCYRDKEIFSSNEKDTLEDVIEVIFELEKDDQDFKDCESFRLCLKKILEKSE